MSKNYLLDQALLVLGNHFRKILNWLPEEVQGEIPLQLQQNQLFNQELAGLLQAYPTLERQLGCFLSNESQNRVYQYVHTNIDSLTYLQQRRLYNEIKLHTQLKLYSRIKVADRSLALDAVLTGMEDYAKHLVDAIGDKKLIFAEIDWVLEHFDDCPFLHNEAYRLVLLSTKSSVLDWLDEAQSDSRIAQLVAREIPIICMGNIFRFADIADYLLNLIYTRHQLDLRANTVLILTRQVLSTSAFEAEKIIARSLGFEPLRVYQEAILTELPLYIEKVLQYQQQQKQPMSQQLMVRHVVLPDHCGVERSLLMNCYFNLMTSPADQGYQALPLGAVDAYLSDPSTDMAIVRNCLKQSEILNVTDFNYHESSCNIRLHAIHQLLSQFCYGQDVPNADLTEFSIAVQLERLVNLLIPKIRDKKLRIAFFDCDGTMLDSKAENFNGGTLEHWQELLKILIRENILPVSLTARFGLFGNYGHYLEITQPDGALFNLFEGRYAFLGGRFIAKAQFIRLLVNAIHRKCGEDISIEVFLADDTFQESAWAGVLGIPFAQVEDYPVKTDLEDFLDHPLVDQLGQCFSIEALLPQVILEAVSDDFAIFDCAATSSEPQQAQMLGADEASIQPELQSSVSAEERCMQLLLAAKAMREGQLGVFSGVAAQSAEDSIAEVSPRSGRAPSY